MELAKEKRGHFLYRLFCPKGIFLTHLFCLIIFFKTSLFKNFAMFTGICLCWIHFLINLRTEGLHFYLKRDSNKGVFLWILRNISEKFFYRRPVHYTFLIFYFMINNWYFRVTFYYCKTRFYKDLHVVKIAKRG